MLDGNEVDEKTVAVLARNAACGGVEATSASWRSCSSRLPEATQLFLTCKQASEEKYGRPRAAAGHGRDEACAR